MLKRIQYSKAGLPISLQHQFSNGSDDGVSLLAEKLYAQLDADFLQIIYRPVANGRYSEEFNIHRSCSDPCDFAKNTKQLIESWTCCNEISVLLKKKIRSADIYKLFSQGMPYDQCIFLPVKSNGSTIAVMVVAYEIETNVDLALLKTVVLKWKEVFEGNVAAETSPVPHHSAEDNLAKTIKPDILSLTEEYVHSFGELSRAFAQRLEQEFSAKAALTEQMDRGILHLLSIRIAAAKDRNELSQVVRETLEMLFSVSGFSVALIKPENATHYCYMNEVRDSVMEHQDFGSMLPREFPINDGVFNQVLGAGNPVVFNVADLSSVVGVVDYVTFWSQVGIKQVIAVILRVGAKDLGGLFLYLDSEESADLPVRLFKAVRDQIAVAVSNILAIEEIERRNYEQCQLRSLAKAFSQVMDRNDMRDVLSDLLSGMIHFKGYLICLLDQPEQCYELFLDGLPVVNQEASRFGTLKNPMPRFALDDELIISNFARRPIGLSPPHIDLVRNLSDYVGDRFDLTQVRTSCISLLEREHTLGFIMLFSDAEIGLGSPSGDFLTGIASQLSLAVSAILRNEELQKKEFEKDALLSLSNDVAHIRDYDSFRGVITRKLDTFFHIKNFSIILADKTSGIWRPYIFDDFSYHKKGSDFDDFLSGVYPVGVQTLTDLSALELPFMIERDKGNKLEIIPDQIYNWASCGKKYGLLFPVHVGNSHLGFMLVESDNCEVIKQINVHLAMGMISQISIALAHLIAEELVEAREREKSMLLDFSYDLAMAKDRQVLSLIIKEHLKRFNLKNGYLIAVINRNDGRPEYVIQAGEDDQCDQDLYHSFTGNCLLSSSFMQEVFNANGPIGVELKKQYRTENPERCTVAFCSAVEHAVTPLSIALKAADEPVGVFMVPGDQLNNSLLKGVSAQIAVAIANVQACEEIQQTENDRAILLAMQTNLACVGSREQLLRIIEGKLGTVLGFDQMMLAQVSGNAAGLINFQSTPLTGPGAVRSHNRVWAMDMILNRVMVTTEPVIIDLNRETVFSEAIPLYISEARGAGMNQLVLVRLCHGQETLAVWMLFFKEPGRLNRKKIFLLESLANQLGGALAQIRVNEQINRNGKEQALQLSFVSATSAARDSDVLSRILKEQLKNIFHIRDFAIYGADAFSAADLPILFDPSHGIPLARYASEYTDLDSSSWEIPAALEGELEMPEKISVNPGSIGGLLDQVFTLPLYVAGEKIAVMNFVIRRADLHLISGGLFKGVSSQIAVCVWNLMTNRRISEQLAEINTYKQRLEEETVYLKEEIQTGYSYGELIGESDQIIKTFRLISQVSASDATVLILGETGTGKELVARAIHESSTRSNKLMVKVNCAALPANLIESELFGHERGSFTGATERRIGKFELANNGTLFLDEIGEMPLDLQVRLLRAIQEREIERVGGSGPIKVNVRIIAATNRNLEKEMEEGRFRTDLYYRLNIFPIELAPLRERKADIQLLAAHFITRFCKKIGREITGISSRALQDMMRYDWPGNIRELEHLIERSILLNAGDMLREVTIPNLGQIPENKLLAGNPLKTIDENESEHILSVLKYCKGRIAGNGGAAEILGVPASTLNSKIKRLGIRKEHMA